MSLPAFEYVHPTSLQEAVSALTASQGRAVVVSGGTDVVVSLKQRLVRPDRVVNVKAIPELQGLDFTEEEGLRIGAVTRLVDLVEHGEVRTRYAALAEAAQSVGAAAHRSMGTVGGNLCLSNRCWYFNQSHAWRATFGPCWRLGGPSCLAAEGTVCHAAYCGDTAPALLALGARVTVVGPSGARAVSLEDLYSGESKDGLRLGEGEIVGQIYVPIPPSGLGSAYRKFRLRDSIDFPLAGAACALIIDDEGTCTHARVAVTGVGSRPERCPGAEAAVEGGRLTADVVDEAGEAARQQAHPYRTTVTSPPFRRKMVAAMVRHAVRAAAARCSSERKGKSL